MLDTASLLPSHFRPLTELDEARRTLSPGARLLALGAATPRLRDAIGSSGKPTAVRTFDLVTFPYPTKFALGGAFFLPLPVIMLRSRMLIVQFTSSDGRRRILLVNPTDYERSVAVPYVSKLVDIFGEFLSFKVFSQRHYTVGSALAAAGIDPAEVDYITYDHLHTQDVRRLLGTTDGANRALLPNARLLVQREELHILECLHPLQRPWYVPDAVRGVDPRRILPLDRDILVGPGVALIRTPGHTVGNHTIVLHTDEGLWTISENGIAADAYAPLHSAIPGLRRYARYHELDFILNGNTRELTNEQYSSMVVEKALADTSRRNPEFKNNFISAELTAHPLSMGLSPTYTHGTITHGELVVHDATHAAA